MGSDKEWNRSENGRMRDTGKMIREQGRMDCERGKIRGGTGRKRTE